MHRDLQRVGRIQRPSRPRAPAHGLFAHTVDLHLGAATQRPRGLRRASRIHRHLFRRQGYAATGINQILATADVKAGSLYHHFPDGKAELAAAVVDGVGGDIARLLRTVLASERPPAEIVATWIDLLAAGLDGDQRDGCPIEPIATESVNASAQMRDAAARAFAGWCTAVADRLIGDGWPDDRAAQTAQSVIALIEGALILSRIAGDRSTLDAAKVGARTLLNAQN